MAISGELGKFWKPVYLGLDCGSSGALPVRKRSKRTILIDWEINLRRTIWPFSIPLILLGKTLSLPKKPQYNNEIRWYCELSSQLTTKRTLLSFCKIVYRVQKNDPRSSDNSEPVPYIPWTRKVQEESTGSRYYTEYFQKLSGKKTFVTEATRRENKQTTRGSLHAKSIQQVTMLFLLVDLSTGDLCDVVKFLCIDIFLFARSSFHLSGCLATTCRLVLSSVGLSVNWSVFRWSVFPLVCLSSRLAGCQSVSWSFRLLVCLSVSLPFVCLSVCVFAFRVLTWLSSFQPTRPLVCLSFLSCLCL